MKPAPFEYYAPTSVAEALDTLDQLGYDGKVLAGGQSLIAAMNFRMARPAALVDLNNIPELFYIKPAPDGGYLIGTMTRDATVEHHPEIAKKYAIIPQSMYHVAHPQIRNRGTFGGNVAHADPAGQMPAVTLALDARYRYASKKSGERWIAADEFFVGPFSSVLNPDDLLLEVHLPVLAPKTGTSYHQVSRQHGSQAQVGVCVKLTLDGTRCKAVNIVMMCVGERALLAHEAMKMLVGQEMTEKAIEAASEHAAAHEIDPSTDIHATAEYRRSVAATLIRRALSEALQRASGHKE
jgi:carbon-monoxide dehydrogenase medium subunit